MSSEDVLQLIEQSSSPLRTLEIARSVYGAKATSKTVNPMLYSLERSGRLIKISEPDGSNPRWTLPPSKYRVEDNRIRDKIEETEDNRIQDKSEDNRIHEKPEEKSRDSIVTEILSILSTRSEVPTLEIAKAVYGSKASARMINPILYSLERERKVVKISEANGTKPRWSLILT